MLFLLVQTCYEPWRWVFLEMPTAAQPSRNSQHFMESKGSQPSLQEPATGLWWCQHNVTRWLKAGMVEQEPADARQWHSKHISTATNKHTTKELLEAEFSVWSKPRLYSEYTVANVYERVSWWASSCSSHLQAEEKPEVRTFFLLKRRPHFRTHKSLQEKNLFMGPNRTWNQDLLCWWGPAVI